MMVRGATGGTMAAASLTHLTELTPMQQMRLAARTAAALACVVLATTACDDKGPRTPMAAPPSPEIVAIDDARIGRGLPAESRIVGLEHNRLSMSVLASLHVPSERRAFRADPCRAIMAGVERDAGRSAAAAGVPGGGARIVAFARLGLSGQPRCANAVRRPTQEELVGDARVTADGHPDSVITDAALLTIDRMISRIQQATSESEIGAALSEAAQAAAGLSALDAVAVQSAVSQTQGSWALWAPGGAGWNALQPPLEAQHLFRTMKKQQAIIPFMVAMLSADASGCAAGIRFLRLLGPIQHPSAAPTACFAGAAVLSLYYAYEHLEE